MLSKLLRYLWSHLWKLLVYFFRRDVELLLKLIWMGILAALLLLGSKVC